MATEVKQNETVTKTTCDVCGNVVDSEKDGQQLRLLDAKQEDFALRLYKHRSCPPFKSCYSGECPNKHIAFATGPGELNQDICMAYVHSVSRHPVVYNYCSEACSAADNNFLYSIESKSVEAMKEYTLTLDNHEVKVRM